MHGYPGWHFWPIAFSLTLLFEAPVAMRLLMKDEPRTARRLAILLFANLATHPIVWFFFPGIPLTRPLRLALSEAWAFLAEAGFYWLFCAHPNARRAVITSLLANALSFGAGSVILRYWGKLLFRL